jgi:hypothetical protein
MAQSDNLAKLAIDMTNASVKYVDVMHSRKTVDRLQVLKRIREYENENRFSEDVEMDPPSRPIKPGEVDYTKKKIKSKLKTRFAYFIARRFLNKINRKKIMIVKDIVGKDGYEYGQYDGLCLETQTYPNSINTPSFPSPVYGPDRPYDAVTVYKFN